MFCYRMIENKSGRRLKLASMLRFVELSVMWSAILNALSSAALAAVSPTALDPFVFFRPSIAVSADDRRELDRGQPIARVVRGADREIGVFAAIQVSIDGDRLVAWTRDIGELKKSPHVLAIGRFSDPPTIQDLERLTLDDEDLSAIRRCQRGDCGLKLAGAEMDRLRQTLAEAGDNWKPAFRTHSARSSCSALKATLRTGMRRCRAMKTKTARCRSKRGFPRS